MLKTFPSRKSWFEHEITYHMTLRQLNCQLCVAVYHDEKSFLDHAVSVHDILFNSAGAKAALLSTATVSVLAPFESLKCPLRSETGFSRHRQYATHLGKHLESISLASLPQDNEDDALSSSEAAMTEQSSPDISSHTRRTQEPPRNEKIGSRENSAFVAPGGSPDSEDPQAFQPEGNHDTDAQPRSHYLYQKAKDDDGYWRCPFQEETKCNHEPTPQKCGYHKYLDYHIKPFVCTYRDCGSPRFSSNASLFRHQREAHGLHGHGENPHLCHYPGCDRARERNGFPRKWNLKDHMKRAHGWMEQEDTSLPYFPLRHRQDGLHGHGENPHLCHYPGCDRAQERNGFPRKWNLKDYMKRVHGWVEQEDCHVASQAKGLA